MAPEPIITSSAETNMLKEVSIIAVNSTPEQAETRAETKGRLSTRTAVARVAEQV